MSTLYIRLPSKAAVGNTQQLVAKACPYALVSPAGAIAREGMAELSSLAETVVQAGKVVLLLSGSDTNVMRLQVPPLSPAKLRAALPNLVEEHLLSDPATCVVVAGSASDGWRTIAVTQREWIDFLAKTFVKLGARSISALPSPLCLGSLPGTASAAILEHDAEIDVTVCLPGGEDAIGLTVKAAAGNTGPEEVMRALAALVPTATTRILVAQEDIQKYQRALDDAESLKGRATLSADKWTHWIGESRGAIPDLMSGIGVKSSPGFKWHAWRWPLLLGLATFLTNVMALNLDWWHMKSESDAMRSAMTQIYKSAFPNETVIIDPLAQMQQKLDARRRGSGLGVVDDFPAMAASFGEAWGHVKASLGSPPSIAGLEYRDRGLLVRFKPGAEAPTPQMKVALAERGLSLELMPSQSGVLWQIRSVK